MSTSEVSNLAYELMSKHGLTSNGWRFEFNNRKKSLGVCSYRKKTIYVSQNVLSLINKSELINVILHEIAHALVGANHGHGYFWQKKAIEIGCNGQRLFERSLNIEGKYKCTCPECGNVIYKHRKPTRIFSCGHCSGSRYNPKYRLIVSLNENY